MANEAKVYQIDNTIESPNGEVNGSVRLVTAAGATMPAALLPALPTTNGTYTLTVASGVYSWVVAT